MRIVRVNVPDFGPLRNLDRRFGPGLNVVYGRNESGKTALLDFLLAHLFRKEGRRGTRLATALPGLRRFGDATAAGGKVELRLGEEVFDYPGHDSLLDLLKLEYVGLAGLFCVRSGELDWPGGAEGFWRALKRLLSGLPEGVETLMRQVHGRSRLTPTGERTRADRKRHEELEGRIVQLEELVERLPEAARREAEIADLERRQAAMKAARRGRIAELSASLREARARLASLADPPPEELDRWREAAAERDGLEARIDEHEQTVERAGTEADQLRDESLAAKEKAGTLESRRRRVEDARLEERARDIGRRVRDAEERESYAEWALRAGIVFLVVALVVSLETAAVPGGFWILLAATLVGGGALLLGLTHRRRMRELTGREEALLEAADELDLRAESAEELPARIEELEDEARAADRAAGIENERHRSAVSRAEEAEAATSRMRERLDRVRRDIDDLREKLGAESFTEARNRRRERETWEERARKAESSLTELAGPDPDLWEVEPPETADLPSWDPAAKRRIDDDLERAHAAYRGLRDEFVRVGLAVPEDALTELRACREEMAEIELDWEAGRLAAEIFATMGETLDRRLEGALSRDGDFSVGDTLQRITGRYGKVRRSDDAGLQVYDARQRVFPLGTLSRGTRDQVFLALRVGLASAALKAAEVEGGFLLLDDAFLTADWERRERLVEMTAKLSRDGLQILYLTCDDHLRDLCVAADAELHELDPPPESSP